MRTCARTSRGPLEVSEGPWRPSEFPGSLQRPLEASGGLQRPKKGHKLAIASIFYHTTSLWPTRRLGEGECFKTTTTLPSSSSSSNAQLIPQTSQCLSNNEDGSVRHFGSQLPCPGPVTVKKRLGTKSWSPGRGRELRGQRIEKIMASEAWVIVGIHLVQDRFS